MKVTPYTGYKVNSYQTIYDKDGKVIDSHFEASSNYKVRNKVILQAPAAQPGSGTAEIPRRHTGHSVGYPCSYGANSPCGTCRVP